jgi:hypothetical protein
LFSRTPPLWRRVHRRERFDHVIVFNEAGLQRLMTVGVENPVLVASIDVPPFRGYASHR